MKIIFFNVDGVLSGENFATSIWYKYGKSIYEEYMLSYKMINQLKRIVNATGSKLVCTSSWKEFPERMEALKKQLADNELELFEATTYAGLASHRKDEIDAWMACHDDVESFVIIDTEDDYGRRYHKNLVISDYMSGMTREIAKKAIEILNKQKISAA